MQQNQRYRLFYSTHTCQNLVPTLPTMQVDHWQFGWRFRCVMLVMANIAMEPPAAAEMRSYRGLDRFFFHFQTCSLQLTLTQVTSLEDIYLVSCIHGHEVDKRLYIAFFTYAVALPKTCKQTLTCKIWKGNWRFCPQCSAAWATSFSFTPPPENQVHPRTEAAFLMSLFVLLVPVALSLSLQHTTVQNTTTERSATRCCRHRMTRVCSGGTFGSQPFCTKSLYFSLS